MLSSDEWVFKIIIIWPIFKNLVWIKLINWHYFKIIFFPVTPTPPVGDPCSPSPCGLYAECRAIGDQAACSCLKNYIGLPPNCRPECVVNTDCPPNQACISEKCRDPCIGSCGQNADCRVQNHIPVCLCQPGYTGDPFTLCSQIIGIY